MKAKHRDPRVIKAVFDVWLSRDMLFNNPPGRNLKIYRKHTKAQKIKYTSKICRYLDRMEEKEFSVHGADRTGVAIKLDGKTRYVWREDVLSEKEFSEVKERQKSGIRALRKKSRRNVG